MKWINKLIEKSSFPKVESVEQEFKKIGLLRIVLGIILFVRFFEIANSLYFFTGELSLLSIVTLSLIILFTIGIAVPITTVSLIVVIRVFDAVASTNTLGTSILLEALLGMLLVNAGQYYSIDNLIIKNKNFLAFVLKKTYSIIGTHTSQSLTKVYFLLFLIYGLISLGALGLHIQDEYWSKALTIKSLLSNSYLSTLYLEFRWFENTFPVVISLFSFIGIVGQSLFQFFMLFLVFNKWGNIFVKWWGLKFFIISLFVINLSYLPHVEVVLWFMIFFPIKLSQNKVSIIYDDHCNLCKKAMLFFKKYNYNDRYTFLALSKNRDLYESNNLTEKEVKTYMVGWYKGKIYKGYDLYYKLLKVNPLFWFLVPLFLLGYLTRLGPFIYNEIAENRYKVFGQCEISFEDEIQVNLKVLDLKYNKLLMRLFYYGYISILVVFILFKFPYIKNVTSSFVSPSIKGVITTNLYRVGLEVPNVFNKTDLSMGDNWMVIYRKEKNKDWEIIPFTAEDGKRLTYESFDILNMTNHNSDFLYFGTTLQYRRNILSIDDFNEYHKKGFGYESLVKRIKYDYKYLELKNDVAYKVIVYSNQSSIVEHWIATPERHNKEIKFKQKYMFDGNSLTQAKQ